MTHEQHNADAGAMRHLTAADLTRARSIVDSPPAITTYASCEWAELDGDGREWIAVIVREAIRQAAPPESLDEPKSPTRPPDDIVTDQRKLAAVCGEGSVGRAMATEAADAIERLVWQRAYAIRWANESVASVQKAMFACRDALAKATPQ